MLYRYLCTCTYIGRVHLYCMYVYACVCMDNMLHFVCICVCMHLRYIYVQYYVSLCTCVYMYGISPLGSIHFLCILPEGGMNYMYPD